MKMQHIKIVFVFILLIAFSFAADAQCAMCKASAEHSGYANKLNTGILYLLFAPVVVLGGVLLFWVKNKEKFSNNPDNKNA
jgi:hypothetical protein